MGWSFYIGLLLGLNYAGSELCGLLEVEPTDAGPSYTLIAPVEENRIEEWLLLDKSRGQKLATFENGQPVCVRGHDRSNEEMGLRLLVKSVRKVSR